MTKEEFDKQVNGLVGNIRLSKQESLNELKMIVTVKENEVLMNGMMGASSSYALESKRELIALRMAQAALEAEIEREELFEGSDYQKNIEGLESILEEATRDEDSVCYVTDVDAPSLKAGISALKQVGEVRMKLKEHDRIPER